MRLVFGISGRSGGGSDGGMVDLIPPPPFLPRLTSAMALQVVNSAMHPERVEQNPDTSYALSA